MNTTKNISMGGYAFIIEEDAYLRLKKYTEDVKMNLAGSPGADEIMADIEVRIAEILRENKGGREVVTAEDVNTVISRMGEPEVYMQDDNREQQKQKPQDEDSGTVNKRLYRDPENKILGGVCGGLAAYLGVDPVWIRLAFVITTLFYSTGFWVYIILWIIMPLARTRAEKLQMRGQKANLKNIQDSIRSEFSSIGDNMNNGEAGKEIKSGFRKLTDVLGEIFSQIFKVLGKILEIGVKILAALITIGSLVFLIGLLFMALNGISSVQVDSGDLTIENVGTIMPLLFESATEGWLFYLCIVIFLGIPAAALLANSIRYLANITTKTSKWISITAVGIWLMTIVGISYCGIRLGLNFSSNATGKTEEILKLQPTQTLYLRLDESAPEGKGFVMDDVSLDIRESADSNFVLRMYKEASGRTEADAERNQRSIEYKPILTDSVLSFKPEFVLPEAGKIRAQSVTMELRVPRNRRIYLEPGIQKIFVGIDNVQNMHDSEMPGQVWEMTERGLSCLNCPIPDPIQNDSLQTDTQSRK